MELQLEFESQSYEGQWATERLLSVYLCVLCLVVVLKKMNRITER